MKVFQIENNICYWDATKQFPSAEATVGFFPPDLLFVEAPDNVFEGWGYIDGEFIQPTPPEGWLYDAGTGTFYREGDTAPSDVPTPEEQLRADLDKLAGEIKNMEPSVGNAALESTVYLNRILLGNAVKAGSLTPTQVMACDALVEPWAPGVFEVGDVRATGGQIWRCVQGHDSTENPGWKPESSRVFWVPYHTTDPANARPYVAPTMAEDAYNMGECMIWTDNTVRRALRDGVDRGPDVLPEAWEIVTDTERED